MNLFESAIAIRVGFKMKQKQVYQSNDINGYEIIGIELPLTARLFTENGEATEFNLAGILDSILRLLHPVDSLMV
jgi:hypothetical protein